MTSKPDKPLLSSEELFRRLQPDGEPARLELVSLWPTSATARILPPTEVPRLDWPSGATMRRSWAEDPPLTVTPADSVSERTLWIPADDRPFAGTVTTLEFDRLPDDLDLALQGWMTAARDAGAAFAMFALSNVLDVEGYPAAWPAERIYAYYGGGVIAMALDDHYRDSATWRDRVREAIDGGTPAAAPIVRNGGASAHPLLDEWTHLENGSICLELVVVWPTSDAAPVRPPQHVASADRMLAVPLWVPDADRPLAATITTLEFDATPADLESVLVAWLVAARSAGAAFALFVYDEMEEGAAVRSLIDMRYETGRLDGVYAYAGGAVVALALDDDDRAGAEWRRQVERAAVLGVPSPAPRAMNNIEEAIMHLVIGGNALLQRLDDNETERWFPEPTPGLGWRLEHLAKPFYRRSSELEESEFERVTAIMRRLSDGEGGPDAKDGAGRFGILLSTD